MPYKAFISYSHTEHSALARALQLGLHRLAKPRYRLRTMSVYRDEQPMWRQFTPLAGSEVANWMSATTSTTARPNRYVAFLGVFIEWFYPARWFCVGLPVAATLAWHLPLREFAITLCVGGSARVSGNTP